MFDTGDMWKNLQCASSLVINLFGLSQLQIKNVTLPAAAACRGSIHWAAWESQETAKSLLLSHSNPYTSLSKIPSCQPVLIPVDADYHYLSLKHTITAGYFLFNMVNMHSHKSLLQMNYLLFLLFRNMHNLFFVCTKSFNLFIQFYFYKHI